MSEKSDKLVIYLGIIAIKADTDAKKRAQNSVFALFLAQIYP